MTHWIVAAAIIWLVWTLMRKPKRVPLSDIAAARDLLGVPASADALTIRAAHRRLMAEAHPDRGGSDAIATRLNAARDLLLARVED